MAGLATVLLGTVAFRRWILFFRDFGQAIPVAQAKATSDDGDLVRDRPRTECSDTDSVTVGVVRRAYNANIDEPFSLARGRR